MEDIALKVAIETVEIETEIGVERWDDQTGCWFEAGDAISAIDARNIVRAFIVQDEYEGRSRRYRIVSREAVEVRGIVVSNIIK